MKLLKGIGTLFVKLWRWIKETAWVQPLLIVGAIFAVIFSIDPFTKWIDSLSTKTSNAYFVDHQVSLNKSSSSEKSDADKLTDFIQEYSFGATQTKAEFDALNKGAVYGEKFLVAYVSSSCGECETFQPALEYLEEQWGSYVGDDKNEFKLYTIFADEESDNDDEGNNALNKATAFERYLEDNILFFNQAENRLENPDTTPYTKNEGLIDSEKFSKFGLTAQDSFSKFPVPTIMLIDFTEEAFNAHRQGVSEILFGIKGSGVNDKCQLVANMWTHLENNISNPFSSDYAAK